MASVRISITLLTKERHAARGATQENSVTYPNWINSSRKSSNVPWKNRHVIIEYNGQGKQLTVRGDKTSVRETSRPAPTGLVNITAEFGFERFRFVAMLLPVLSLWQIWRCFPPYIQRSSTSMISDKSVMIDIPITGNWPATLLLYKLWMTAEIEWDSNWRGHMALTSSPRTTLSWNLWAFGPRGCHCGLPCQ